MRHRHIPFVAILLVALFSVAADKKPEKAKEPPPSSAQIQLWIKQLGDEKFKVREKATQNLINAGGAALDAVTKATKSDDAEVKQRALRIIEHFDKQSLNLVLQGNVLVEKELLDKAIAKYSEAIKLKPRDASAYNQRAQAWGIKGNHDRAILDYNKAIQLRPKYSYFYSNRGVTWEDKGEFDKAIADFTKAIQLNPKSAGAYINRGAAWHSKGKLDRAFADYNEAIRLNPRDAYAYQNRGFAWKDKGDKTKAEADFKKAKELGYTP